MHVTVTVKMVAQTKGELVETFPSSVNAMRSHFSELRDAEVFGPTKDVQLRFLVIGGQWHGEQPEAEAAQRDPNNELGG